MIAFFKVAVLAEVVDKLSDVSRRAELCGQADAAERETLEAIRLPDIIVAEAALAAADRPE